MKICPLCWMTDHELRETQLYQEIYNSAKDKTPEEIDKILKERPNLEKLASEIFLTDARTVKLAYMQVKKENRLYYNNGRRVILKP